MGEIGRLLGITRQAVDQALSKYIKRCGAEPLVRPRSNQKKKILFVCNQCGEAFESATYSGRLFCSHKCWREYHAAKDSKWSIHTVKKYICDGCGVEFERNNKLRNISLYGGSTKAYCTQECYWKNGYFGKGRTSREIAD